MCLKKQQSQCFIKKHMSNSEANLPAISICLQAIQDVTGLKQVYHAHWAGGSLSFYFNFVHSFVKIQFYYVMKLAN